MRHLLWLCFLWLSTSALFADNQNDETDLTSAEESPIVDPDIYSADKYLNFRKRTGFIQIQEIGWCNDFYIIYATMGDEVFKIATDLDPEVSCLKRGDIYLASFRSLFPCDEKGQTILPDWTDLPIGMIYKTTPVLIEPEIGINDVYTLLSIDVNVDEKLCSLPVVTERRERQPLVLHNDNGKLVISDFFNSALKVSVKQTDIQGDTLFIEVKAGVFNKNNNVVPMNDKIKHLVCGKYIYSTERQDGYYKLRRIGRYVRKEKKQSYPFFY